MNPRVKRSRSRSYSRTESNPVELTEQAVVAHHDLVAVLQVAVAEGAHEPEVGVVDEDLVARGEQHPPAMEGDAA